jgi:hypothetical protein
MNTVIIQNNSVISHSFNNSKHITDLINLNNHTGNNLEQKDLNFSASQKIKEEDILSFFK